MRPESMNPLWPHLVAPTMSTPRSHWREGAVAVDRTPPCKLVRAPVAGACNGLELPTGSSDRSTGHSLELLLTRQNDSACMQAPNCLGLSGSSASGRGTFAGRHPILQTVLEDKGRNLLVVQVTYNDCKPRQRDSFLAFSPAWLHGKDIEGGRGRRWPVGSARFHLHVWEAVKHRLLASNPPPPPSLIMQKPRSNSGLQA